MNKIEFYSNLANFQGRNGDAFLKHYGILGQKWGQRRWQNADGTFNEAGKERYFGKGSKNSSDDEVGRLFAKKKKNKDANVNKNIKKDTNVNENNKKETTVDYLNKLLEEEAKRREKYKHVYNYIQEKNENGKYEDEYGEYDDPDFDAENEKLGGLFNKKNVDPYNDKYRTYKIKDMDADWEKLQQADYEALTEDLNTYDKYLNKMEKDTNLPKDFIEKYYRNVKSDAIEELSKKYPNIAPDKLLSVDKFNDDEYLQELGDSYACRYSKETDNKINELKEKRNKYPEYSAKWNKINSEIEQVEYQEWIKNSKQEKEFYKDLEQYIENNYNKIKEEAQEQYKRNPEWDPADDAITGDTDNGYYNIPNIGILTTTAEKEYGYKYNKDKFNIVTLDKGFKSKDDGNINLKLDIDEYRDGGISVKEMKQRMKNDEKFIKNFDKTNDYVRSEVADWLYDQYCDDMEYYDKKPLSYQKFLNKINLQPDIDSRYYSKDENKYHAIYHLNIPGYEQYCTVDFVGDGKYVDVDSLD